MKKLLLLTRVMRRCSHAEKDSSSATSSHVGNLSALLLPAVGLALVVGMFFAGKGLAENQAKMGSTESIFSTIMVLGALGSLVVSIPQVINQLYMSNDLDVLVTLPVTDLQIVAGKLISVSILPLAICCGLVFPCGVGFGIYAGETTPLYWVTLVLAGPLLALSRVAVAGLIVILLMRMFRFIRSRNMISIISTLAIFGLTMLYMVSDRSFHLEQVDQVFNTISSALSGMIRLVPTVTLCANAMTGSGVLPLLEAVGITLAEIIVLFIAAKLFYFSAALSMQDANGKKRRMSGDELRKSTRSSGMRTALFHREVRTVLRTPSMITNGYLYSLVVPLVITVPILVQLFNSLKENMNNAPTGAILDTIRALVKSMNPGWEAWCIVIITIMGLMVPLSVAMSVLSRGMISREGKDFAALKAMPVDMRTVVMVKRDVALLFNGISGFFFPVIIMIAAVIMDLIPIWVGVLGVVEAAAILVFMVDLCSIFGVKKPNLNWEAEADACKNNIPGLVVWFVLLIGIVVGAIELMNVNQLIVTQIAGGGLCVLFPVLALIFDIRLRSLAAHLPERY